ncbi:DUF4383 domain-containing protein [Symbioplanes lichenis]|uniref:DUF4383 domain-containing protein n=1 Tax=Symbioplanes lichenis TaxID=1629072 RepID=UPI0027384605|nr:DUF4383 domain-containing protein [Actinoplanes lichenis]
MAHYPINHQLRQPYRALAAASGLFVAITGVIGIIATAGNEFFGHAGAERALGQLLSPAGAWVSTLVGLLVLAVAVRGGNLHHRVNLVLGWVMLAVAMVMLAMLRTDADVLGFSVATVVVWTVLGLVVLTAALYGQVGSEEQQHAEQESTLSST